MLDTAPCPKKDLDFEVPDLESEWTICELPSSASHADAMAILHIPRDDNISVYRDWSLYNKVL